MEPELSLAIGAAVGVDLGITNLAITADRVKYPNYRYTYKAETQLQRSLSRKAKESANRSKARIKAARLQERIANQRLDCLRKVMPALVKNYDIICIEDLVPKNMVKNHRLAKSISDASWSRCRRQLTHKAAWYGKAMVITDRFHPSSQLCSVCSSQWTGTEDLSVREWICPECGTAHNRDVNAAQNILNEGLHLPSTA